MIIYVLSRFKDSYSTSRIIEESTGSGHKVKIIDYMYCELLIHKGFLVKYQNVVLKKPDVVIARVGASSTRQGAAVLKHFQCMGVRVLTTPEGLIQSRDKFLAMQLMKLQGLPMPKTMHFFTNTTFSNIQYEFGNPPFIIKLLESTQGLGVFLAHNKTVAEEIFKTYLDAKEPFLVQEFIKESSGKDIRAFVVGDDVVASMERVALEGEFRSNLHRGGTANKVELSEEERDMAIRAAKTFGLEVAGVDILRSKRGPLLLEVNSSPGLEGIEKYSGVNVTGKIIKWIEQYDN